MGKVRLSARAIVLLAGMASSLLASRESVSMVATAPHSDGCHQSSEHGDKDHSQPARTDVQRRPAAPASRQPNYPCCQIGHNSVALQSSITAATSNDVVHRAHLALDLADRVRKLPRTPPISFSDPPNTLPLRI
jgi:hypothetical protein